MKDYQSNQLNPENRGLFLIGLMGSGKTFWADKLSNVLNIPAYHLDDEIERSEGKTIAEIFKENGENYFRLKESEVLRSFNSKENFILSTGGGAPCFFDNMDWMNLLGITIWIDETPEIISGRLLKEKSHRPLLADVDDDKLVAFISEMREKRMPFYVKAKHHLTGNSINQEMFLKAIQHE